MRSLGVTARRVALVDAVETRVDDRHRRDATGTDIVYQFGR